MRAWLLTVCLLASSAASAAAAGLPETSSKTPEKTGTPPDVARAAERYEAGDYRASAEAYETLLQSRPRSSALHYDLGNCLFQGGQTGRAIAEYQRAFDIRPRDRDIRYNLDFALRRAGETLVPAGVPPFIHFIFFLLSDGELAGLHWLACWATLLLASLLLLRESLRRTLPYWGSGAAACWLFFGGWWAARTALEPSDRAVVIRPAAEIRSGPGEKFSVAFTAPEGRRVEVISGSGDWLEIGLSKEGAKGWVLADAVERVAPP